MPVVHTLESSTQLSHTSIRSTQCYVCWADDPVPPSPCKCVDRHAHRECLRVAAMHRKSATCPVCLELLSGLRLRSRSRVQLTDVGAILAATMVATVVLGVVAAVTSAWDAPAALDTPLHAAWLVSTSAAGIMAPGWAFACVLAWLVKRPLWNHRLCAINAWWDTPSPVPPAQQLFANATYV